MPGAEFRDIIAGLGSLAEVPCVLDYIDAEAFDDQAVAVIVRRIAEGEYEPAVADRLGDIQRYLVLVFRNGARLVVRPVLLAMPESKEGGQ